MRNLKTDKEILLREEIVVRSGDPDHHHLYTPSVIVSHNRNIVVTHDIGGDIANLPGYKDFPDSKQKMLNQVYVKRPSDKAFVHVKTFNMCHARLFRIKNKIYLMGHDGRVQIASSSDGGESWTEQNTLFDEFLGWHASSCNVILTEARVYLCMERRVDTNYKDWNVAGLAPYVLSAPKDADLSLSENWKLSNTFSFSELLSNARFAYFGIPYLSSGYRWAAKYSVRDKEIKSSPMGWLEGNMVQIHDRTHVWFDERMKTFYIFLRCNTAGVGYAAILKVVEDLNCELSTELVRVPSGEPLVFLPFPGGHNKFFIVYDTISRHYWLAASQAYDSMTKLECLEPDRYGLPNNERHRLILYFSKNCVDWIFAGVIAIGEKPLHARNYPAMCIDGEDLLIAVRAGDDDAKDSQYTNLITLYTVEKFRDLLY